MALSTLEIKNAKPGMLSDGQGLYLYVKESGAKSWIFRYELNKRRREMGLGPLASLAPIPARAEAARLKALTARGIDPLVEKEAAIAAQQKVSAVEIREATLNGATFEAVAERYLALREDAWNNAKHRQQWTNTLRTYAFPILGTMPVRDITTADILRVLEPIWREVPETASRVRMRIEAVLSAAKQLGLREGENPALWRGGLDAILPSRSKVRRVKHHAAMPWLEMSGFCAALRLRPGIAARALEFTILTAGRSGEIRHALWSEIDLEGALWVIPAERMKSGREHRVPLSGQAISILKAMPQIDDCPIIFPGSRLQPLSDMSLAAVLKRMSLGHFTVHGFRSTFRDWAAETTDYPSDLIEMALAHSIGNKVEAAYRRGDMMEKRRKLMEDWASWTAGLAEVHVRND